MSWADTYQKYWKALSASEVRTFENQIITMIPDIQKGEVGEAVNALSNCDKPPEVHQIIELINANRTYGNDAMPNSTRRCEFCDDTCYITAPVWFRSTSLDLFNHRDLVLHVGGVLPERLKDKYPSRYITFNPMYSTFCDCELGMRLIEKYPSYAKNYMLIASRIREYLNMVGDTDEHIHQAVGHAKVWLDNISEQMSGTKKYRHRHDGPSPKEAERLKSKIENFNPSNAKDNEHDEKQCEEYTFMSNAPTIAADKKSGEAHYDTGEDLW